MTDKKDLLRNALLIRRVEETLLALFAQGKLSGTVHTCVGQEWVGIALAEAMTDGDALFSSHRGHGHFLARYPERLAEFFAELMGKATGVCAGRGGSQHLHADGFFSNGVQGSLVPIAAGHAMAMRLRVVRNIAAVCIGDGTLGEGIVYETLNIAARWALPLLVVLEDNGYAQSTPKSQTLAGTARARAAAFGIEYRQSNTWQWEQLLSDSRDAARFVREQQQPLLLEVQTYRLRPHSTSRDHRDPREVEECEA
ncbi:thiamine pyrophosphate-dependent dehydrogenase E1 component subunit alpha, partial [bacterium]|nr:thiamine pyrophosphate-dependent dehydrogenase E1 component subunit alpha [bacterium]